jgi:hypothetical protein
MISKYETKYVSLQVNLPVGGHKAGTVLKLRSDGNGKPLNSYWRRRIVDAKIDNCVTLLPTPKKKKKKEAK